MQFSLRSHWAAEFIAQLRRLKTEAETGCCSLFLYKLWLGAFILAALYYFRRQYAAGFLRFNSIPRNKIRYTKFGLFKNREKINLKYSVAAALCLGKNKIITERGD